MISKVLLIFIHYPLFHHSDSYRFYMQRFTFLFLCFLLLSGLRVSGKTPAVVAHRGYHTAEGSAENSIRALIKADSIGADYCEFDVWISADDVLYVNHNADIEGVVIETSNSGEIDKCKLKNGERIPRLETFLDTARNLNIGLILEVKPHKNIERENVAIPLILQMIDKKGLKDRTTYITFSRNACRLLADTSGRPVQFLTGVSPEELKSLGATGADFNIKVFRNQPEWLKQYKASGVPINIWTVNSEDDIMYCIENGADFITTNQPELAATLIANHAKRPVRVYWESENLVPDSTGVQYYMQKLTVSGDMSDVERLCFNQFCRPMEMVNLADTLIELVPGYYTIASPRFAQISPGDSLVFEIRTKGALMAICYGPDGLHTVNSNGQVVPVECTYMDISSDPRFYATQKTDRMPYGDTIFAINERISQPVTLSPYDVVPSFKEVKYTGGNSKVDMSKIEFRNIKGKVHDDQYTITVRKNKMIVEADPKQWLQLDRRLKHLYGESEITLPNAKIIDWPTFSYRGVMIDIARNYQTPTQLRRILDLMAIYGLNRLHFHALDDEAWRVEIPALPELTQVGAHRGYGFETGEYLPQIFAGDGHPDTMGGPSNGFFTRQDYIDMILYADSLGIAVIPEIESPGHARAAIYAMKQRAKATGDTSLLLAEDGDTSVYTSAQSFHDNIMNPALEGPYKFMDIVSDAFIDMHRQVGVPLLAIHIGGDEVPRAAWDGSPAMTGLKQREGLKDDKEVHAYFVKRLAESFARKGIKMSGWQEIALRHAEQYNKQMLPLVYSVNCWQTLPVKGQNIVADDLAAAGYPVVLSNVQNFYLDMTYSYHPEERGLSWGGSNDEFSALNGYPAELCTTPGANIIGISGQAFAETIRNPANQETMLLPKMLGLAERAWNPEQTYSDQHFHNIVNSQIPLWEHKGYAYHVRPPGIRLVDSGKYFVVNSPYPDAVVRYTTDGSKPNGDSPMATPGQKIPVGGASRIRATLWLNGHPSVTTLLFTGNK